ncbi:T9SS type A sorting domain-containing protein [Ignavibacterium album]|uniref:T9SS type A sorting domain-containing protein n=1 Tax=Ignavibacterium album TaxID=591197 RepID=UPI0026EA7CDD|nr:T9SS type A sorting domain-containing protein [Ignavibacterium album]
MNTKIFSISILLFLITTTTNAQQWEFVGLDSLVIFQLCVSGDTIYAGTWDKINNLNSGLYFSSNEGSSWIRLDSQLGEGAILALERNIDNTLYIIKYYVTTGRTLFKSTDNGQNWSPVNNISNNQIKWFGIAPFNPNEMYAIDVLGLGGGNNFNTLFKSTNRGNSWESIGSFPGSSHGSEITFSFDMTDSMNLYVSVDDRWSSLYLFKSTNKGDNWFYVSSPPVLPTSIFSDYFITSRIYLFPGPYISNNSGYNWFLADSGLTENSYYVSFYQDKLTTKLIYTLYTDGLYESGTNTIYWKRLEGSENLPLDLIVGISNQKNVTIDEKTKQIYVGTSSGIYRKSIITGLPVENSLEVNSFILEQNFPNPFNPRTKIKYHLPVNTNITLKIFDLLGNELATLVNEEKPGGDHEIEFNGENFSSGVYVYTLLAATQRISRKMILLK